MPLAIFRIKKYKKGWVAEIKKPYWTPIGMFYRWRHYISVAGIQNLPWYFGSKEIAESELIKQIQNDEIVIEN